MHVLGAVTCGTGTGFCSGLSLEFGGFLRLVGVLLAEVLYFFFDLVSLVRLWLHEFISEVSIA